MAGVKRATWLIWSIAALAGAGLPMAVAARPDIATIAGETTAGVADAQPAGPAVRYPGPTEGREAYRAIFAALAQKDWDQARGRALALDNADPVRAVALQELYTAKDSPRVELFDLLDLMARAGWLPDVDQLGRMAQKRGATTLPGTPQTQELVWLGSASRRQILAPTRQDIAAQTLAARLLPFIKNDDPAGAEALLTQGEADLSPDGLAEVRQRVAWSYYIGNRDTDARRVAESALQAGSRGDWTTQAYWTIGLASWRQDDPRAAAAAFAQVASHADNDDMASAGAFWAARAFMNAGEPGRVEPLLRQAAQREDSFYGLLALETLGLSPRKPVPAGNDTKDLRRQPTIRAALALHEIGQDGLAAQLIQHQAKLGGAPDYDALLALSASLGLAETQLWLAHHGPAGTKPDLFARFPMPNWRPDGGWRVDPALVYAHALQESGFRPDVVSPAGARGLMQVMPGTAQMMAGAPVSASQLADPATNIEYGQRYLEMLRDNSATGGLLPKVMAAYNAGPLPVARWNTQVRDNGDPLLFMESLPYYETRAYVNIVMRNYWIYELQNNGTAPALTTIAQGGWPRFPGARPGAGGGMSNRRASAESIDRGTNSARMSLDPDSTEQR